MVRQVMIMLLMGRQVRGSFEVTEDFLHKKDTFLDKLRLFVVQWWFNVKMTSRRGIYRGIPCAGWVSS